MPTDQNPPPIPSFKELGLSDALLQSLESVGYETPSPIQAQTIPHLLGGGDLLGHAPTGTGKTAAFALPLLDRLITDRNSVQVLVLTPTRELAIQVAEAFQRYAQKIPGFHVLPVYGGQPYAVQIRRLKQGVQVVVGTPGRIMDHMRKGTLDLSDLQALVLDEADEMLRMGFLEDVHWILDQTPAERQTALFSATMPREIKGIAGRYLRSPREIRIKAGAPSTDTIRQRYWPVARMQKLEALTRILEVEDFEALLLFARTKQATTELAERLEARGYAVAALNGDMAQKDREKIVARLRAGSLDILVATDVAARGLDVERISHVINYDIPYDAETYVHRIGRTGRAGRSGEAILFVAPREKRMLAAIEKSVRRTFELYNLPTAQMINDKRVAAFKETITQTLAEGGLEFMRGIVEQVQLESKQAPGDVAAALAKLAFQASSAPLVDPARDSDPVQAEQSVRRKRERKGSEAQPGARPADRGRKRISSSADGPTDGPGEGMERFRIEVGLEHGVKPANIVGAIANEAGLDAHYMGRIDILADHSLVDMPAGMPREIFRDLKKTWVCGRQLAISRLEAGAASVGGRPKSRDAQSSKAPRKDKAPRPRTGKPSGGRKPAPGVAAKKAGRSATAGGRKPAGKPAGKPARKPARKTTPKATHKPAHKRRGK